MYRKISILRLLKGMIALPNPGIRKLMSSAELCGVLKPETGYIGIKAWGFYDQYA